MNEQLLKDFIATAQKYNYNWNKAFGLFPELEGYDQQLLKDYVATAEKNNYDYKKVNSLFPELGFKQEPLKKKDSTVLESKSEDGSLVSQKNKEEVFFLPNDPSQLYTKKGDEWYKKIGSNYLPLTKGDVAQRSAYLNQNAQKASQFDIDRAAQSQTSVDTKKLYAQDTKELKKSFEQKYGEVKSLEKINEAKRQEELKKQVPQESEKLNFRAGGGKIYDFDNENEVEEYKDIAPAYYMAYYDNNGKPLAMMDPEKMKEAEANMKKDFGDKEFAAYMSIDKIPSAKKLSSLGEQAASDVLNKQFEGTNLKFERSGSELIITSQLGDGINATVLNEKVIDLSEPDADKKLKSFISHNIVKKSEREKFDNVQSVEDLVELVGSKPYKFKASLLEDMNVDQYFERERQILDGEMVRAKADTYGTDLKSYEQKVIKFNQDVKGGKMSKEDFDARSAQLENERRSLLQRKDIMSKAIVKAEKIDKLTNNLEKANVITAEEKEKQGSFLGNISRGFGEGLIDVSQAGIDFAISAGSALTDAKTFSDAITPGEYERLINLGYSDDEIKNEIQKSVKSTANKVLGTVPDVFGFGTTEEYSKSADRGVIDQAAFAIGESLGAVAGGIAMAPAKAGTTAGFFSMSYNGLEDQMRGPQFDALSENEKKIMSVPYGLVIGALEKLGAKVATGAAKSKTLGMFSEYIMAKTFSSLPKNASLLEIKSAIDKSVALSVANGMLKITGAGIVEGGTEFTQQIFEGIEKDVANRIIQSNQLETAKEEGGGTVSKEIYNQIVKNKFFKDAADLSSLDGIQQLLKESGNAFVVGALAGGMGGAMSVGVAEPISNKVSNNKFAIYRDIILDDAAREGAISSINKKVENDQLTREEADEQIKSINESYPALRQIPTEFSVGAQREAFGLLMEREKLNKEIADKDPNLVAAQTERVKEINEQLKGLSYAVQEQGADAVSVQSGTGVSTEMEEGVSETKPQVVTGETITEEVEVEGPKAEQPKAEVAQEEVAEKITVNPSEGYSFEYESENDIPAELKGVEPTGRTETKVGRGKNAKTKLKLTFTGQQLIDAGLAVTPEAQEQTPAAQEAGVAEVVQPEVQETVQAEPTAKIETIEVQEVPQVEQTLNDLTQQNNVLTQNDFTAARIRNVGKEKVVAQIAKAAKAIAKVLPKVKIVVHATPEAFVEATKDMDGRLSEGGLYDRKTGQIHINLEKASNRTVAHEVFHALILSRVNTDLDAQRLTRSMIGAVRKSLKKAEGTTELISYLEDFESNYDENIKNEEKLAELFAILADNYKQLPPASKNVIIRFLNRLAKALGLKEMTDREAIEFMNTLSRKVETGQEIEAREVGKQKEGEAAVRKQKGEVVKSKIDEDWEHTITLNGKKIGKIWYDKSQKTWNNIEFDRRSVDPNTYQWVYGDVVGENKQEAIDEMVRRYKEKESKPTTEAKEAKIKYTNDQVTNSFLNALNEKENVSRNPISNKEFIYGDKASLEFSRFDKGDRNEIAIQSISTFDKGKGVGKQVMKDITDTADELGVTLTLDAKPFGNEGLNKEQLINFYKNNGFVANVEEMFGGEFESEEELIDYVINEEPEAALQMTRQPSTRQFAVRKQKTTSPNRIVENGVKAGKTDAQIRQEGKAAGFTNKEMTEALSKYYTKEQKVFMKSGVKGLVGRFVDGARRFKQQYLTSKGLLPKIGFTYKEKMEGEISAEANRAAKTAKKFGVLFDKFTGDKELLLKAFDKALRGDKSIQLPAGFARLANEMRNHIDRLSQMLIDSGAVDADMADTIRDNMGTYITRSYEIFDNKNFRQKVGEQELQAAKNFLRTQPGMLGLAQAEAARTGVTVDEALDVLVDNKIDEYFADAETGALVKGSKLGSKDLSTLKERKEIPEQIRMLMGEYSDPAMNYVRTVLNIASLAARHKFLTQVKEAGMGKFFFEKNDSQKPKGFDTEIASEGSDTMSPLNGLMTTPEIAEAFGLYNGQQGEDTWVQQAIKIYYKAMGLVKWLKTIGSVATHAKNIFSNLGFVAVNGHSLVEIGKAIKVVAQDLKTMSKPEVEAKIDEYIKAGIMRQGAGINEIRDMFKDADMDGFLERRLSMRKPNKGVVGKIKQAISSRASKIISAMEDAYQAEDDMFKIAAYETEMNRYAEALYNKSKDQLTDKQKEEVSDIAANNVKNTYPTYSRIPEGIKRLRRFPLFIGSFISFQAEAYRTAYNTIGLAKDELSSKNKDIKKIGAKRVAGASAYLASKTAILSYLGYAAGTGIGGLFGAIFDDDDEEKKDKDVRSFLPDWSKNSDLIVLKAADGEIEYIDFSASDPHGGINKALNAFLKGDDLLDSFKQSTLELVGQFQGPDILTNLAIQLKGNENDFGKPIYNEEDSFAEKTDKILDYVYKVVEPGTITSIRKAAFSEQSLGQIAFGDATGLKIRKSNVKDQFGYKLPEFDDSFKDIRKIYNSEYYKSIELSEDPKATKKDIQEQNKKTEDALVRANEKYAAKAKELMDLINSANRLGVDYDDLINELGFIKSTMGKSNISEMENGGDEFIKEKED